MGLMGTLSEPLARHKQLAKDLGGVKEIPSAPRGAKPAAPPVTKITFTDNSRDYLNGRYVNSRFEPLTSATVRAAVGQEKLSNNAELIVAKRVPFRIAFEMDERRIPKFLAACANSPFRFEVRQIRINRHVPGQTILPDGKDFSTGPSGPTDESGTASANTRRTANKIEETVATRTNYFVKVEFYGVVKVYNPVNKKLFDSIAPSTAGQTASTR
jgi:hypothetical protein